MAKPYRRKDSPFWWIPPTIQGVQVCQSSGETDYDLADRKLKILEGKIAGGVNITPQTDRGSFKELLELVRRDYKKNQRANLYTVEKIIDVTLKPLHHLPAAKAWLELDQYVIDRRELGGVANGTINNELSVVKSAYRLGRPKGLVSEIPEIELLPKADPRDGYYTPQDLKRLVAVLPPLLRNILIVAYITGWRMRSILKLPWSQVDLVGGWLWQTEKKNKAATRWPIDITLELAGVSLRDALEEQKRSLPKDRIVPYVFHRKGKPVKSVYTAFKTARRQVGITGHVFHDFRGTAIVNLLEAGVDTPRIMAMVGLKTQRMVIDYAKKRGMRDDRLIESGKLLEMRLSGAKSKASTT